MGITTKADIESNQEIQNRPDFPLTVKNILILLGVLLTAGFMFIAQVRFKEMLKRPFNNRNRHRNPTNFNRDVKVMLFNDNGKIFALDPLRLEKGVKLIAPTTAHGNYFQLSNFKSHAYFQSDGAIKSILIENREFCNDVNVRGFEPFGFVMRHPNLLEVIYTASAGNDAKVIRQYDRVKNDLVKDHGHRCQASETPEILGQVADGSKILYKCGDKVYLKNLNETSANDDAFLFDSDRLDGFVTCPDGEKLINCKGNSDSCTLIDLSDPANERAIRLTTPLKTIKGLMFSDDNKNLHIIHAEDSADHYDLTTIDYEKVLGDKYPQEISPVQTIKKSADLSV